MLKLMINRLRECKQTWRWYREFKLLSKLISGKTYPQLPEDKFLLLVPHSDDEWMTNSRLIIKKNVIVVNMNMDGGDSQDLHEKRLHELENSCKKHNRYLITIKANRVVNLIKILNEEKPEYIVVPFFIDWHPEHLDVIKILHQAILECEAPEFYQICMYTVSCPMPQEMITHAESLDRDEWMYKWRYFLKQYPTQRKIPYKRFAFMDRVSGLKCNSYASEVYRIVSIEKWKNEFQLFAISEDERNMLRNSLSSLSNLESTVSTVFQRIKNYLT